MIEPVDPFGGGEFDVVYGAPRAAGLDYFGLVQTVDRLGKSVVEARTHRADTRLDSGLAELFSEVFERVDGQRFTWIDGPLRWVRR